LEVVYSFNSQKGEKSHWLFVKPRVI
jgi:hypothetical protein